MNRMDARMRHLEGREASGDFPTLILLKAAEGAQQPTRRDGQVWAAIIPGHGQMSRMDDETEGQFLLRIYATHPHLAKLLTLLKLFRPPIKII